MATNKNFVVKNGLIVGGQEVISSSGVVTSAALGGQTLSSTDSPTFANLTVSNDLAVSGDLNLTGDLNITGNVNTLSVTDLDVTDKTITLGAGQVASASGGSGIVVERTDSTNPSILWDETNDVFDFNKGLTTTGFVAIGTSTTSGFSLDISGANNSQLRLLGTDTNPTTIVMDYNSTGSTDRIRIQNDAGDMKFTTNNGQVRQTLLKTGKVGIGTENPLNPLHISHSTDGEGIQIDHTTVGGYSDLIFTTKQNDGNQKVMHRLRSDMIDGTSGGEDSEFSLYGMHEGSEKLGLRIDRTTSTFINSFTTYGDFSTADTAGGNYHEIGTWAAGGSSRITIRINGSVGFTNNSDNAGETVIHGTISNAGDFEGFFYGIGSNSTATAVAVKANGDGTHTIYIIPGQYGSYESHVTITKGDVWTPKLSSHSTGSSSLPSGAVGLQSEFGVNISGTRKLYLDGNGKLGVGDYHDPLYSLDIRKNTNDAVVRVAAVGASTAGSYLYLDSEITGYHGIGLRSGTLGATERWFIGSYATNNFTIKPSIASSTSYLTIDTSGNIGINESSPNAYLHVTGKASYTTANSSEVSGLGFIRLQPNSGSEHSLWIHNASNNLGISGYTDAATSSSRDISLQAYGGNVSIGTPAATGAKLHVAGGIKGTDLIAHDSTGINLQTDEGTKRLIVLDSGNILVGGTTERNRKLVVEGTGDLVALYSTNTGSGGAQLDLIHDSSSAANDDAIGIINFSTDDRQYASIRGIAHSHSAGYGELRFGVRTNTSTYNHDAMILDEDGKLGIGVSPNLALHVDSGVTSDIARFANNNGSFVLGNTGNLASVDLSSDSYQMRIRGGSQEYVRFDKEGLNIGYQELYNSSSASLTSSAASFYTNSSGLIGTGSYLITVYLNGGGWYSETWCGIMQWYSGTTNSANATDIYMTGMGHAPNNRVLAARVLRTAGNANTHALQLWDSSGQGSSGHTITIRARKLAD